MRMRKFSSLLLVILFLGGCGYTTGSLLPSHLKTIYVRPFRNKIELTAELAPDEYRFRTYRSHLETDVTKEVIDKFINGGHLKVVEEENANLILTAELVDYLRTPVRYGSDNETVEEYRISIVCSVKVKDVREDVLLWQNSRVIGDATYDVSESEDSCVSSAVSDLARRIVNHTIERW